VARDERETGERALLNLGTPSPCAGSGHRFLDRLFHGEGVAIGMVLQHSSRPNSV